MIHEEVLEPKKSQKKDNRTEPKVEICDVESQNQHSTPVVTEVVVNCKSFTLLHYFLFFCFPHSQQIKTMPVLVAKTFCIVGISGMWNLFLFFCNITFQYVFFEDSSSPVFYLNYATFSNKLCGIMCTDRNTENFQNLFKEKWIHSKVIKKCSFVVITCSVVLR